MFLRGNIGVFVCSLALTAGQVWAQADTGSESDHFGNRIGQQVENPGGPEDDSYIHPETLIHRAGFTRRADQASAQFGFDHNSLHRSASNDRYPEFKSIAD